MKKVSWVQLPKVITKETSKIVKRHTEILHADIVKAWPVKSGKSKAGWKMFAYTSGHYAVRNFVKAPDGYNYVADLWIGLPVGSEQLPMGGQPIFLRNVERLDQSLKGMTL